MRVVQSWQQSSELGLLTYTEQQAQKHSNDTPNTTAMAKAESPWDSADDTQSCASISPLSADEEEQLEAETWSQCLDQDVGLEEEAPLELDLNCGCDDDICSLEEEDAAQSTEHDG